MSAWRRSIPWTFVRLKVRLLRNRARTTKGGRAQLLSSVLIALLLALFAAPLVYAAAHGSDHQATTNLLVVGASAMVLGWTVLPLLSFGTDETVDPARLTLFPLEPRPLMGGMVLSSLLGPAPTLAIVLVTAAVAGASRGPGAALAVPVAAAVVLLAVTCARTASTLLAAALTSRRGRDLTIVVAALLALTAQAVRFLRLGSLRNAGSAAVDSSAGVLRWLPPGMAGHALSDASDGRVALALVELVPAVLTVALLLRVWRRALDRSMTVVVDGETASRKRRHDGGSPLLFRRLPFIRPTPWGAVAAKELRYAWRDPRRKVNLINATIVGVVGPVALATRAGHLRPDSVLIASLCGYVALLGTMNQFGFDRGALWMDVAAGDVVQPELLGKNLATCTAVAPLLLLVGVGLAAASGGWAYVPATWLLGIAGMGAGLGIANVVSVRYPVRLPESRSPLGGQGGGQGCATSAIILGCVLLQNVAIAPVGIAAFLAVRVAPISLVVVAPACAAYGAAMWWAGVHVAAATGRRRMPELLQAVDPAQSDRT